MQYHKFIIIAALFIRLVMDWNDAFAQCSVSFTSCPSNFTITDCDKSGNEPISWPLVIANPAGFCGEFSVEQTSGPQFGESVPISVKTIEYTARGKDYLGNQSTAICSFQISIVEDTVPPVFAFCPGNDTVSASGTNCSVPVTWPNPIPVDNCAGEIVLNSNILCGSALQAGNHMVNYQATDPSGNIGNCSFSITVECIMVGTIDVSGLFYLRISPNPNTGTFTVTLPTHATPGMRLRITDLAGRTLQELETTPGTEQQTVQAGALPDGLYFLQVLENDKVIAVEKFVKQ